MNIEKPQPFIIQPQSPEFIDFAEERLELGYDYGVVGGPEFRTEVIEVGDGREQRNVLRHLPLGRWQLGQRTIAESEVNKLEEVSYLKKFHEDRKGAKQGFRFKDWSDYQAVGQLIAIGDGVTTQWQMRKSYQAGSAIIYRPIQRTVEWTVDIYVDGVNVAEDLNHQWEMNHDIGILSHPTPLPQGAILTANFEFDVPVWFESDQISFELDYYNPATQEQMYKLGSVFVVEQRLPFLLPWSIGTSADIDQELNLGIVYQTNEKFEYATRKIALASGYSRRESKRDSKRIYFDYGDRLFDRAELDILLGYFWNAKGKAREFTISDKGNQYIVRFNADKLNIKFEASTPRRLMAQGNDALYKVSGLKLQLKELIIFKLPPYAFLVGQPTVVNPNDVNDPTVTASNPGGSSGGSGSSGSSSSSSTSSSSSSSSTTTFSISTYAASGTNFDTAQPAVDPWRDYNIVALFWQANSLWMLVRGDNDYSFSNNAGRNRTFLYRGTPEVTGGWTFQYVDIGIYDYAISSNPLVLANSERTIVISSSSQLGIDPAQYNDYTIEDSGGLLELVITNQGQISFSYIPGAATSDPNAVRFERPFFAFPDSVLLNTSNNSTFETLNVYNSSNFNYYNYERRSQDGYSEGYPLVRGHIPGSGAQSQQTIDLRADTTPGNVYAEFKEAIGQSPNWQYKWDVYYVDETGVNLLSTLLLGSSFAEPQIVQTQRDDGSYALSIKYGDAADPSNIQSVCDFYWRSPGRYQWQLAGSLVLPSTADANRAVYDRYGSNSNIWKTDRYGNGFFFNSNRVVYYKSGSNAAVDISSLINGDRPNAVCNSPFGFIIITVPQFGYLFSSAANLYIVSTK